MSIFIGFVIAIAAAVATTTIALPCSRVALIAVVFPAVICGDTLRARVVVLLQVASFELSRQRWRCL